MKKIILTSLLFFAGIFLFGQSHYSDSTAERPKNVIVIDATGLLRQFFNFNTGTNYYYFPNDYIIGYRRKFGRNEIRLNIGGQISQSSDVQNDTLPGKSSNNTFSIAIGYERHRHLTRRWSMYYGGDLIYGYRKSIYLSTWALNNSENDKSVTNTYGFGPLLGLIFGINRRMQLATETNYQFLYEKEVSSRINTLYPQYNSHATGNETMTNFIPPVSLILRIQF